MTVDPEFLTGLGASLAIFLCCTGSAIASSHAGIFAIRKDDRKYFIPILQAGVLSVYGLIVGILLCRNFGKSTALTTTDGYKNLFAGLSVGLASWASGYGMASFLRQLNEEGKIKQIETYSPPTTGTNTTAAAEEQEPLLNPPSSSDGQKKKFKDLVLIMIFLEGIGFYGFILSMVLIFC